MIDFYDKRMLSGDIPVFAAGKGEPENGAYYAFPTKDQPIPTLKFMAARAGVNDLRYLEMLEKQLSLCADPGQKEKYRNEIQNMLATFSLLNGKGVDSENYRIAPQVYDDYKNKIQDMLVELRQDESQ